MKTIKIKNKKKLIFLIIMISLVVIIFLALVLSISERFKSYNFEVVFSGIATLISLLAFGALVVSIYIQNNDIKEQSLNIKKTNQEIQNLVNVQKESAVAQNKQIESSLLVAKVYNLYSMLQLVDIDNLKSSDAYDKRNDIYLELRKTRKELEQKIFEISSQVNNSQ